MIIIISFTISFVDNNAQSQWNDETKKIAVLCVYDQTKFSRSC